MTTNPANRELLEKARDALAPFARAEHIVAQCDHRIRCVLTYPEMATETFTLGSLEDARAAVAAITASLKDTPTDG